MTVEVPWFAALCDDDYEFLGVPDPARAGHRLGGRETEAAARDAARRLVPGLDTGVGEQVRARSFDTGSVGVAGRPRCGTVPTTRATPRPTCSPATCKLDHGPAWEAQLEGLIRCDPGDPRFSDDVWCAAAVCPLHDVDPAELSDAAVIDMITELQHHLDRAGARQARLLAEFIRRRPDPAPKNAAPDRAPTFSRWAPDEVALALSLSRVTALTRLAADALWKRLVTRPAVRGAARPRPVHLPPPGRNRGLRPGPGRVLPVSHLPAPRTGLRTRPHRGMDGRRG